MEYRKVQNSDELYHFGIPGMRWGRRTGTSTYGKYRSEKYRKRMAKLDDQRAKLAYKDANFASKAESKAYKKRINEPNSRYSARDRTLDEITYGPGRVKKINQYLNSGDSLDTARSRAYADSAMKILAKIGITYVGVGAALAIGTGLASRI